MLKDDRRIGFYVTVAVLEFVPGHSAARLVPLHQTSSAADTARLVFNSRPRHVWYWNCGHTENVITH